MENMERPDMKGALCPDDQAEILYKGKIKVKGKDKYVSLVRSKMPNGDPVCELVVSLGRVYENYLRPGGKNHDKEPDIGGPITIDGVVYRFGSWFNTDAKGEAFLGASLREEK